MLYTQWKNKIPEMIMRYRQMEKMGGSMLLEVKWQYADMSSGGDGGELGFEDPITGYNSCRDINYPGYPDCFFQEVCDLMSWPR